jgi:hypothetical protein
VERLQCSFEKTIKNMQQKGPPIKLPRASTQSPTKPTSLGISTQTLKTQI